MGNLRYECRCLKRERLDPESCRSRSPDVVSRRFQDSVHRPRGRPSRHLRNERRRLQSAETNPSVSFQLWAFGGQVDCRLSEVKLAGVKINRQKLATAKVQPQ